MLHEQILSGGFTNAGLVTRVGDTVRRPLRPTSTAIHAMLAHLERAGFDGAPRFLGVDEHGRETLSYIPGDAVVPPYPAWALTDEALVSVAELLRRYHDAVASFDSRGLSWPPPMPERFRGAIVTHNDPNLDNVIFRDGRAVALIDFDLAGPGSRIWDVACAARLWAPLRPDIHISDTRRGRTFERFRLFVDSYGMNDSDRLKVAEGVEQNYMWFYHLIKSNAASGHAAFAELWTFKTMPRAQLTIQWHAENKLNLRTALGIQPVS